MYEDIAFVMNGNNMLQKHITEERKEYMLEFKKKQLVKKYFELVYNELSYAFRQKI